MSKIILLLVLCVCHYCSCIPRGKLPKKNYLRMPIHKNCNAGSAPEFIFRKPGDYVALTCPQNGSRYKFFHNKLRIGKSKRYSIRKPGTLEIKKAMMTDAGSYKCRITDRRGRDQEYCWVLIVQPIAPTLLPVQRKQVTAGQAIAFRCPKSSRPIHSTENGIKEYVSDYRMKNGRGVYELANLEVADSGNYYCGKIKKNGRVRIDKNLFYLEITDLPRIRSSKANRVLLEDEFVRLSCLYNQPQSISWFKDGKPIPKGKNDNVRVSKYIKNRTTVLKLVFKGIALSDSGEYECRVNVNGKVLRQRTRLQVFGFVKNHGAKQGIVGNIAADGTVMMSCETNQDKASISFFHQPLNSRSLKKIGTVDSKSLQVSYVYLIYSLTKKDQGNYSCKATFGGKTIQKKIGSIRLHPTRNQR